MEQTDNLKVQLEGVRQGIRNVQEQRRSAEQVRATIDKRVAELEESRGTLASQVEKAKAEITGLTARYADGEPVEKSLHRLKATMGTLETKLATVTSALEVAKTKREEPITQIAQIEKALKHEQEKFWQLVYEIELPSAILQVRRILFAALGGTWARGTSGWVGFHSDDVERFFVRKFFDANSGDAGTVQAVQQQLLEDYGHPSGEEAKPSLLAKLLKR